MKVVYYPEKVNQSNRTALKKFIECDLKQKSLGQWEKMIHWFRSLKRDTTTASALNDAILREKNKLKGLKNGLYEYRGSQSKKGTIRVYFCFDKDTVYILDAEFKTDDNNIIDRARDRKDELGL